MQRSNSENELLRFLFLSNIRLKNLLPAGDDFSNTICEFFMLLGGYRNGKTYYELYPEG